MTFSRARSFYQKNLYPTLFGPKIFLNLHFLVNIFLDHNFFGLNSFWPEQFFWIWIFFNQNFFGPNIFFTKTTSMTTTTTIKMGFDTIEMNLVWFNLCQKIKGKNKRLWLLNIQAHSALRMSYIGLTKYLLGLCIQYNSFYILWQKKTVPQKYKFCVLINVRRNKCHWRSIRVIFSGEFIMESNTYCGNYDCQK